MKKGLCMGYGHGVRNRALRTCPRINAASPDQADYTTNQLIMRLVRREVC
jgi:hypothetical protein